MYLGVHSRWVHGFLVHKACQSKRLISRVSQHCCHEASLSIYPPEPTLSPVGTILVRLRRGVDGGLDDGV
jgi:hypothetical protein